MVRSECFERVHGGERLQGRIIGENMNQTNWLQIVRTEPHHIVFHILNSGSVPSPEFWLEQPTIGKRLKKKLRDLLQKRGLVKAYAKIGIPIEQVAAILIASFIKNNWFDKTLRAFKRQRPPFDYEKRVSVLKKVNAIGAIGRLIQLRARKKSNSQNQRLIRNAVRCFDDKIDPKFLLSASN